MGLREVSVPFSALNEKRYRTCACVAASATEI
jgi:hypothetical protein